MKVNLWTFEQERIGGGAGYLNLDLRNYDDLCKHIDAGEVDEFRINFCINYIGLESIKGFLETIISRLAYGGHLYVSTVDAIEVARAIYYRQIENSTGQDMVEYINSLLFNSTKNILTLEYLEKTLQELGLKIINKRTVNYGSHIVAEFPHPNPQISENSHNM